MRSSGIAALLCLAFAAQAHAKPPALKRPPVRPLLPPVARIEPRPAAPLPMLPSVARVRVEAARDRVVVVEEVNLPRGEWRSGGFDLYVAFGAPGTPVAIDARLLAVPADSLESRLEEAGDAVTVETAIRRPASAQVFLGRPQMAGAIVRVKEADLRRAYATSEVAALRIRSLLAQPGADPRGARDVVVRLGIVGDVPLTLERVQVVSLEGRQWITHAEANLCGPEAEGLPLAVTVIPKAEMDAGGVGGGGVRVGPIAPVTAVRHASDDLCIRWWVMALEKVATP